VSVEDGKEVLTISEKDKTALASITTVETLRAEQEKAAAEKKSAEEAAKKEAAEKKAAEEAAKKETAKKKAAEETTKREVTAKKVEAEAQSLGLREVTDVSTGGTEDQRKTKLRNEADPFSTVANAIWQSIELQNDVAVFVMEAIVAQACSWMGVERMPQMTTVPMASIKIDLIKLEALIADMSVSVMTFSENVTVKLANASGAAFNMLPTEVVSQYHTISDSAAAQVNDLMSQFHVEEKWRSLSEQMQLQATKFYQHAQLQATEFYQHAQLQATKLLSSFQARFSKYRFDKAKPLLGLCYIAIWFAFTVYLSARALSLSWACLRKLLTCLRKLFGLIIKVFPILCCPCRKCCCCICAKKRAGKLTQQQP
jgi:hypothetical protein